MNPINSRTDTYRQGRRDIPEIPKITFSEDCRNIVEPAAVWITEGGVHRRQKGSGNRPTTPWGWRMSKRSAFNGKESDPSPTDDAVELYVARHAYNKWSKRPVSEEPPLSKDPLLNPSQLARFEQVVL